MIPSKTRKKICERYREISRVRLVADEFGINEKTVRNILKQYGVQTTPREQRNKQYDFDRKFFEEIDSDYKAYMLGFVFGDGSVKKDHLSLEVSSKDKSILLKFRDLLGVYPPKIHNRTRKREGTITKSSYVNLCGRDFVEPLINMGLLGSKSKTIHYPNIHHHSGFIRGLSDSDGGIYIDKMNRVHWSLISSTQMCNDVQNILLSFDIKSRVISTKYDGLSRLVITRKSEAIKLRQFLYSDKNVICLERKRLIFENVHYKKGGEG